VIGLTVGGYVIYERILNRKPLEIWDLVPQRTLFVYEKDICRTCLDQFKETSVWDVIRRASVYGKPVDSLYARLTGLLDGSKQLLVSGHVTSKDDFDFVYYLDAPSPAALAEGLTSVKHYRHTQREFNKVAIHELSNDNTTFSWTILDDFLVASFTPFLLEDVIRAWHGKAGVGAVYPQMRRLPRISGDAGNVYVHLEALQEWLGLFTKGMENTWTVGASTLLDIKTSENAVVLNGFSTAGSGRHLLTLFAQQSPVG